jgi:hypothetical protein
MLVGGATPGDLAAPVPAAPTPASPTADKTWQPHIYGSLASKQHLEVLCGDPMSPFWCLLPHLVLHHLGFPQILDPQLSVMGPPLPKHTGSIPSLYYPHLEPQSPTLVLFPLCRCTQRNKAVFMATFPTISWCKHQAALTTATICQNVF